MSRCTITYSVIALWRGMHFASHFSHMRNQTAINTRWSDACNHPVNHKYPHASFFSSPETQQNAWQASLDTLRLHLWLRRMIIIYMRSWTQKNTLQSTEEFVKVGHSGRVARFSMANLSTTWLGGELFNSIINSPLIQLPFFLFHFRMTISHSPPHPLKEPG